MLFKDIREYHSSIITHVAQQGLDSQLHEIKLTTTTKSKGIIRGQIDFGDGAKYRFTESVAISPDKINRLKYSFHYEYLKDNEYLFFRYDKDTEAAKPSIHAECHLHVNDENDVRYITHETNFSEVFDFIIANFYDEENANGRKPRHRS